jgi:hypothetical protein
MEYPTTSVELIGFTTRLVKTSFKIAIRTGFKTRLDQNCKTIMPIMDNLVVMVIMIVMVYMVII